MFLYISVPSPLLYVVTIIQINLYTQCDHQYRFIIIALCTCLLNHMGKLELHRAYIFMLSFAVTYVVIFTGAMPIPVTLKSPFISAQRTPFRIFRGADLIPPSFVKYSYARCRILG